MRRRLLRQLSSREAMRTQLCARLRRHKDRAHGMDLRTASEEAKAAFRSAWDGSHTTRETGMIKLSARNQIRGRIVGVRTGVTTANVRIEVAPGLIVTASIPNEAVAELDIHEDMDAWAVFKSSDVMIGV